MKSTFDQVVQSLRHFSGQALPVLLGLCVLMVLSFVFSGTVGLIFLALVITALVIYADAPRQIPQVSRLVLAPLDGYVTGLDTGVGLPLAFETAQNQQEQFTRISLRQSVRGARLLRVPVTGTIREILQRDQFTDPNAHDVTPWGEMDRTALLIAGDDGQEYALVIKAALAPHQIHLGVNVGDAVRAGDRLGIVWLYARAELYVPGTTPVIKAVTQQITAGETVLQTVLITQTPNFQSV